MHQHLEQLHPYPFQKLATLFDGIEVTDKDHIPLSIGEPKHAPPQFVLELLKDNLDQIAKYPLTKGLPELREAIANWLNRRFNAKVDAETQVLPVNGTREALFAFAQCMVDSSRDALIMTPNPFYQIYEGAALLAGATPWFLNTTKDNSYIPDIDAIPADAWAKCQLFYACSPGNPTGTVLPKPFWEKLIQLADEHDFVIAADECYSEIYANEDNPPVGLLQVCAEIGRDDFARCVVFHSLSKRSNLPGLRSGFVAGDANLLKAFLTYRTYHGCAMSVPSQLASIAAWNDEEHVLANRNEYRTKYEAVMPILSPWMTVERPEASFYLWPQIAGGDDEAFAKSLFAEEHVTVLPGRYLSRDADGINPGQGHVRMALVAETDRCIEAAERIANFCQRAAA